MSRRSGTSVTTPDGCSTAAPFPGSSGRSGVRQPPVDRLAAVRLEEAVRAREVPAAEEPVRRRVGRRVRGREDVVAGGVDNGALLLRIPAPEEEDDPVAAGRELCD